MKADLSRWTFDHLKGYARVLQQQGRPQVDADWNEITDPILQYLATHPQSTDTLDGIAEWWLLRQRIRAALPRIKRALAHLVARTRAVYRRAERGIGLLHPVSRPCVRTAHVLYGGILDEIETSGYAVLGERVAVGTGRRAAVALPGLARAVGTRWGRRVLPRAA